MRSVDHPGDGQEAHDGSEVTTQEWEEGPIRGKQAEIFIFSLSARTSSARVTLASHVVEAQTIRSDSPTPSESALWIGESRRMGNIGAEEGRRDPEIRCRL